MVPMTDPVLLQTKIRMPALKPGAVLRERLMHSVSDGLRGRFTAVCAPMGYGKTTLLAQWAAAYAGQYRTAWVSLDETDNDPLKFWRYVAHAWVSVLPEQPGTRIAQLARTLPGISLQTFLDGLLNELLALGEPLLLVLDDYHLIREQRIHDGIVYFIDYLPDNAHLAIASRTSPPFPTAKWSARELSSGIGADQLQFTLEEAGLFYNESAKLDLPDRQIGKLLRQTEGWVTGLQLAAISLRGAADRNRLIGQFQGSHVHVAELLLNEVFVKQSEALQRFLLETSVLERMNAAACHAVTGCGTSRQMLETLQAQNLFIVMLDDEGNWFRYHHLFGDFLRSRLRQSDPQSWPVLNRRASEHFASEGLYGEAIDYALQAGDYPMMERLLETHIGKVLQRGEFATLLRWFESVPDPSLRSPQMAQLYTFILVSSGQVERAEQEWERLKAEFRTLPDTEERKHIRSGLFFVKSNLVFYSGRYDEWFAFIEMLDDDLMPENPVFYNFNFNWNEPLVRRTTFGLKGKISQGTKAIGNRFSEVLEAHGWGQSLINLYVKMSLCEGYYEWNELATSRDMLRFIDKAVENRHDQVPGIYVPCRLMQARLHMAEGRSRFAHETVDAAVKRIEELGQYDWIMPLKAFKARLYLQEGRAAQAKKELEEFGLSGKRKPSFDREFLWMTFIRLLGAQRKESEGLRLLEELRPQSERENLISGVAEAAIVQALLEHRRGQRAAAMRWLREALVIGEANGYVRSFLDEGEPMAELLRQFVQQAEREQSGCETLAAAELVAYARKLVAAFEAKQGMREAAAGAASAAPRALVESLSRMDVELLQLVRKGASNRQIAAELHLSEGTVKVYLSRIYGKLGVSSRTQALSAAEGLNLFELEE